jgi:SNF2 family DNA or RNA helicase
MSLENIEKAYKLLKEYSGENSYIINLKNAVYAYKTKTLNDFEVEYILSNHDFQPKEINKIVKLADWYGEKLQNDISLDFTPEKMKITWLMGETSKHFHFYGVYRRSQEKAAEFFAPKNAVLTDFLLEDYNKLDLDFSEIEKKSGRKVMEHQKEACKFLISRKKCILADEMGGGKTFSAILASVLGDFKHILIISPSSVKKTWENELKLLIDEDDITIVQGSKWKDAKYTIINYDILDNFYTIPTQTIKKKELNVDDEGNVVTEYKEKEIVSRSKKIISEAMADSQLFQAQYDLIIIDEAHRLSNSTSGRFKIISDLVKRSNPNGIFELTGTMITNSSKNLYNLLKIIDIPITKDWQNYMTRYCGAKFFFKKNERNAHTALFCKSVGKQDWYHLSSDEKKQLDELLEKKCKKICVSGEDSHMDELQEIIKPYYLRRLKSDFVKVVDKNIRCLHYEMTPEEKISYESLWDEYVALKEDKEKAEKNKKLEETSLLRQWLADKMIPKTISLARKCVELGHKIVIFCAYDNEINKLKEEFGDLCVYHNGKLTEKKKNEAVVKFQTNDSVKVFIGNIFSAGVGLTLVAGDVVIFNNFSFVPADNVQAEDRIHRLNQTKPCTIYYQSFNGTYFDKMLEIVHNKEEVINKIIVTENEK